MYVINNQVYSPCHEKFQGHMEETDREKQKIEDKEGGDYPVHFTAGSLIQLSSGALRPVEDLNTDDFIKSAELSKEVQIDQSVVVNISPSKQKGLVMLEFSVGKEEVQVSRFNLTTIITKVFYRIKRFIKYGTEILRAERTN